MVRPSASADRCRPPEAGVGRPVDHALLRVGVEGGRDPVLADPVGDHCQVDPPAVEAEAVHQVDGDGRSGSVG
jgi:hypothetical protein